MSPAPPPPPNRPESETQQSPSSPPPQVSPAEDASASDLVEPRSSAVSRLLLAVTLLVLSWTLVLVVTGGVDLRSLGIRFSSRDPFRPACVAAILIVAYTAAFRPSARVHLLTLRAFVERRAPLLVLSASLYTVGVALRFGCTLAAGSDSYGYVSQADLWLAGTLTVPQPIAREMPWDIAEWTFAPLGYRPALTGDANVPTYPSGLPILMALTKAVVGACGPFLVVPLLGALLVWLTYHLGIRLASRSVGAAAALLLAASPAFISQLLRPMTDVPVATFLLAAVVVSLPHVQRPGSARFSRITRITRLVRSGARPARSLESHDSVHRSGALATGLLLSLAVLVRPNLAPLAALFLAYVWFRESGWRDRLTATTLLLAGLLPGVIAVAAIHTHLYGAPWKSGYGDLENLYALRYAWTNLVRYPRWLFDTQSPLIVAWLLPLIAWGWRWRAEAKTSTAGSDSRSTPMNVRPTAWFVGGLITAIWVSYVFYLPFDDWVYLRFVLASFPLMLVLAVIGWQLVASRLRWESRAAIVLATCVAVLGFEVGRLQNLVILGRWKGECAELNVAEFVSRHLPPNAVVVSMHYSGLLRHYAHRQTLRYDWLDPTWWPRALDTLAAKGHQPFIVLADWEEPEFRRRFGVAHSPTVATASTVAIATNASSALDGSSVLNASSAAKASSAPNASSSAPSFTPASPASAASPATLTTSAMSGTGADALGLIIAQLGHPARARIYAPLTSPQSSTPPPLLAPSPSRAPTSLTPTSPSPDSTTTSSQVVPVSQPLVISPDAACPCMWRPGSSWR